jgi:hypothetical protein
MVLVEGWPSKVLMVRSSSGSSAKNSFRTRPGRKPLTNPAITGLHQQQAFCFGSLDYYTGEVWSPIDPASQRAPTGSCQVMQTRQISGQMIVSTHGDKDNGILSISDLART